MSVHIGRKRVALWMWAPRSPTQAGLSKPGRWIYQNRAFLTNLNRPDGMQIEDKFYRLLASWTTAHEECALGLTGDRGCQSPTLRISPEYS